MIAGKYFFRKREKSNAGVFWIVSEERRKRKRLIQIVTIETSFTVSTKGPLKKKSV